MKKKYVKPDAQIEKFELSQHIASCGQIVEKSFALLDGCTGDLEDPLMGGVLTAFYKDVDGTNCNADFENICYTNLTINDVVFTS